MTASPGDVPFHTGELSGFDDAHRGAPRKEKSFMNVITSLIACAAHFLGWLI